MFCTKCGSQIPDGAGFCPGCGTRIDAPAPAAEQIQQEPAPAPAAEQIRQEPAAVMPAPQSFSEFAPAEAAPQAPKKKKKKIGGIIAAVSAAAVIGGGAAAGYFCFSNQITRLVKGDAGFAADLEKNTAEFFAGDRIDSSGTEEMISAMFSSAASAVMSRNSESGQPSSADVIDEWNAGSLASLGTNYVSSAMSDAASSLISYFKEAAAKSANTETRSGISLGIGSDLNEMLGEYSGIVSDITDILNKSDIVVRTSHSDDCEKLEIFPELGGKPLFDIEIYTDWNRIVVCAPGLTDYSFTAEIPEELISSAEKAGADAENALSFPPEEVNRILGGLIGLYYDAFKDAKVTYTDGTFTVAGKEITGTQVSTVFTAEQITEIQKKLFDFLKNDEFLRNYCTSNFGVEASDYDKLFSEIKTAEYEEGEEWLEVRSYIAAHGKLIAKEYSVPGKDDRIAFLRDDEGIRFVTETDGGGLISVISTKTGEKDGVVEFTFREKKEAPSLVIELVYKDAEISEYKGAKVLLGSYTLKLSDKDEMIDSIFRPQKDTYSADGPTGDLMAVAENPLSGLDPAKIIKGISVAVKISQSGDKADLRTDVSLDIKDFIGVSAFTELKPYEAQPPVMPQMNGGKCITIGEDISQETQTEISVDVAQKLLDILKEHKEITDIGSKLGINMTESFEKVIAEAEKQKEFYKHYSDYSYSSEWDARDLASDLYSDYTEQFIDRSYSIDRSDAVDKYSGIDIPDEGLAVKVYYDADGKAVVIDDGGFDFIDFESLAYGSSCQKKAYCEITIDPFNSPDSLLAGVCVVYTDDPSDIPSGLPNSYNYIDQLYEWGNDGETGSKDGFVIGTVPSLYEGVSTAKERLEEERKNALQAKMQFDAELSKLNSYAYSLSAACEQFLMNNLKGSLGGFESGTDEYFGYYEEQGFAWDAYSVELRFSGGKWTIMKILTGNDEASLDQITDGELFTDGGKLEQYLNTVAGRLTDGEDIKAELFIRGSEFDGVIVVFDDMDRPIDFTDYSFPGEYDIALGYFTDWSLYDYDLSSEPAAGKYYYEYGKFAPVGSWCACTKAPLTVYPESTRFSDEGLSETAAEIYEKTAAYFEDKGNCVSDDTSYAVSICRGSLEASADDYYGELPWFVVTLSDGDRTVDTKHNDKIDELAAFLCEKSGLGEIYYVYALLYFCDNELVGVCVMNGADAVFIDSFGILPTAEEMLAGSWEPRGFNYPIGSFCAATGSELSIYPR